MLSIFNLLSWGHLRGGRLSRMLLSYASAQSGLLLLLLLEAAVVSALLTVSTEPKFGGSSSSAAARVEVAVGEVVAG